MSSFQFCVCVPARDEAERLPVLIDALARQDIEGPVPVAICVNNTTDDSATAIAVAVRGHADRLMCHVEEHVLPGQIAHAGKARGIAMDMGYRLIDPACGILISTDADCRPPSDWISAILTAIADGADMVGGRIALDEGDTTPAAVMAMRDRLDGYWRQVREIEDAIDPCPWDPAPRHGDHTGASLAITAKLYRAVGGVPPIASGEDRTMVERGIAAGGKLVHPMTVWTRASSRAVGRASGGMAEEMARLEALIANGGQPHLPSFDRWRERAGWRRAMRCEPGGSEAIAREEARLPPMPCDMPLA